MNCGGFPVSFGSLTPNRHRLKKREPFLEFQKGAVIMAAPNTYVDSYLEEALSGIIYRLSSLKVLSSSG